MKILIVIFITVLTVLCQINRMSCDTEYSLNEITDVDVVRTKDVDGSEEHHDFRHLKHRQKNLNDFLLVDYLSDGEQERRISFQGITAKETNLGNSSKSLSLWQLTNGKALIQMIYTNNHELLDCEYITQKSYVYEFIEKFYREYEIAKARNFTAPTKFAKPISAMLSDHEFRDFVDNGVMTSEMDDFVDNLGSGPQFSEDAFGMRNLSHVELKDKTYLPEELVPLMNYQKLKLQCDFRHVQMKKILHQINGDDAELKVEAQEKLDRQKRSIAEWLLAPDTKWCGKGNSAKGVYSKLGGASRADMCCRKHDHCKVTIAGLTTKFHYFNVRPFTISHCACDLRHKRDLSTLLQVPGTKWCGKGWSARKYTDMGGWSRADRCCRQHDKACPFWIMGLESKYGVFNWRVNTIMHCSCDERFRTCLKMADSSDATLVGRLFFNIVKSKCFVLKREKVCKKLSWWGRCEKKGFRKRAHVRDNRKF